MTSSLSFLLLDMQMKTNLFSAARLLSGGHFVPRWFPIGSSLLLLLLFWFLERPLGNNGADARGVKGGGGKREAQLSLPLPSLTGSKPECSHEQHGAGLDSTAPDRTEPDYICIFFPLNSSKSLDYTLICFLAEG